MKTVLWSAIGATFVLAGALSAEEKPTDKEAKMLDGKWQLAEGVIGGKPFLPEVAKKITLTISGNRYVVDAERKDEGTVKYIVDATPKAIEITGTDGPNKGKTFPAIYKLDGDTLTVCYDLSGKARPTEFKSKPDTLLFLATYKKAKP